MHLTRGDLRTYLDHQMEPGERAKAAWHLSSCSSCKLLLETVQTDLITTRQGLSTLDFAGRAIPDAAAAWVSFEKKRNQAMEASLMWKNILKPRYRSALGAALAIFLLGLMLLFPGVRAAASSFLGLFRVEQIAIVEINPANLPNQFGRSATLEEVLSENIKFEAFGEPRQVESVAEAAAETGLSLRFPEEVRTDRDLMVQYGAEMAFEIDAAQIDFLLSEVNRTDISFPDSLNGSTVTLSVFPSVVARYGDCPDPALIEVEKGDTARVNRTSNCMMYLQMPSPTIDAPADLNFAELGGAFLQLMGMSEAEAVRFSEAVDWSTTLVVPLPQNQVNYEYLTIDGVQGVLITATSEHRDPNYMLLWVKDGVIYSITGQGTWKTGIVLAESLP